MALTAWERLHGPRWYVVGRKPDGTGVVLGESRSFDRARRLRDRLAAQLEDYAIVAVEAAGQPEEEVTDE